MWKYVALICPIFFISCTTPQQEAEIPSKEIEEASYIEEKEMKDTIPQISKAVLVGKFEPSEDSNFVQIASQYTSKPSIYLHKDAYHAFQKMEQAAKEDGIALKILSATRNFYKQKEIWERKWNKKITTIGNHDAKILEPEFPDPQERAAQILKYSSMPGTSRHHWGTDIDLNNLNNSWFEHGEGKKIYEWLQANAAFYGFGQPYTKKDSLRLNGYEEEKWHWSFLPLSKIYLKQYLEKVSYEDIGGFDGAKYGEKLKVIENYVAGISPNCK